MTWRTRPTYTTMAAEGLSPLLTIPGQSPTELILATDVTNEWGERYTDFGRPAEFYGRLLVSRSTNVEGKVILDVPTAFLDGTGMATFTERRRFSDGGLLRTFEASPVRQEDWINPNQSRADRC